VHVLILSFLHAVLCKQMVITITVVLVMTTMAMIITREHWIQRTTFAANTNVACSRSSANRHAHVRAHCTTAKQCDDDDGGDGEDNNNNNNNNNNKNFFSLAYVAKL